jgi:hypothetical protein
MAVACARGPQAGVTAGTPASAPRYSRRATAKASVEATTLQPMALQLGDSVPDFTWDSYEELSIRRCRRLTPQPDR